MLGGRNVGRKKCWEEEMLGGRNVEKNAVVNRCCHSLVPQ